MFAVAAAAAFVASAPSAAAVVAAVAAAAAWRANKGNPLDSCLEVFHVFLHGAGGNITPCGGNITSFPRHTLAGGTRMDAR